MVKEAKDDQKQRGIVLDGAHVKAILDNRKLSQADLAKQSNISPPTLSRIISGSRAIALDEAYRVAEALEVPLLQLLGEEAAKLLARGWVPAGQVRHLEGSLAEARQSLQAALSELAGSRARMDALNQSLEELQQQVSQRELQVQRAVADNRSLQARLAEAEERRNRVESEFHRLQIKCSLVEGLNNQLRQQLSQAITEAQRAKSQSVGVGLLGGLLGLLAGAALNEAGRNG